MSPDCAGGLGWVRVWNHGKLYSQIKVPCTLPSVIVSCLRMSLPNRVSNGLLVTR
jgi:hypothetical protein